LLPVVFFTCILGVFDSHAQKEKKETIVVSAQIVDENSTPLPNIVVKSFYGHDLTTTDKEGKFSIKVAKERTDRLFLNEDGYKIQTVEISGGSKFDKPIVLEKTNLIDGKNEVSLPYMKTTTNHNVASIYTIKGDELLSYPSLNILESLAGRIPGLVVQQGNSMPGFETVYVSIRGETAVVYVDGLVRSVEDLSVSEVESVQVLKDFSGRAALGIMGSAPVLWIETKKGHSFQKEMNVSAEYGMSAATAVPEYLNSFDYATLHNKALTSDGLDAYYNDAALNAYKTGSDPIHYPDIDYRNQYLKSSTPYTRANINFRGGDEKANYYTMFDYVGSNGFESAGNTISSDRIKMRTNVNIKLLENVKMNVNISGTFKTGRYPNGEYVSSYSNGDVVVYSHAYNIFNRLSGLPANAHPTTVDDKLIISDDYPINIDNDLLYTGYGARTAVNTQNNASLMFDLKKVTEGLSAKANISFDAYNDIQNRKGGTGALYRMDKTSTGADTLVLIVKEVVTSEETNVYSDIFRRTLGYFTLNYDRTFGNHAIVSNATYYQGTFESRGYTGYQPEKMQNASFRGNYTFKSKYIAQADLVYTGSMRLPKGDRFSTYPTVGLGWVASNESFISRIKSINYLKFAASMGVMGTNNFAMAGYNSYYLYQTLWQQGGYWRTGALGTFADATTGFTILQEGSSDYVLPKTQILNIGVQSSLFNNSLSVDLNYYRNRYYDLISQKQNSIPTIFGSGQFLPATNYGEAVSSGFDAAIQFTRQIGDVHLSLGGNMLYTRGHYVTVDEPSTLEDYRKRAGKDVDEFILFQADGLFQNQTEIDASNVTQVWGDVKPGDIRYVDYNNDQKIDEKDQFRTGAHAPRLFYGVNLSLGYKRFNLLVIGQGQANGESLLNYNPYIVSSGSKQNYTKPMLDSWPATNDYPRLSTTSTNNIQPSTFWLINGAYFKVKNVEFSYSLPPLSIQKLKMSACKVFVRGTNLFSVSEFSKYGLDPENTFAGASSYALYQTFTIGLSCKF